MYSLGWAVPQGILVCDNHQVLTMFTRNVYKKCNVYQECKNCNALSTGLVVPHSVGGGASQLFSVITLFPLPDEVG